MGAWSFLFAALLTAGQSLAPPAADSKGLQGHWEGTGPGGECSVTISGNSLHFRSRDEFWFETTFTLHPSTDSPQLHATIVSSADESTVGTIVVAVFELEGETLRLGVIEDFDEPPVGPVDGGWDQAMDRYDLKRVSSSGSLG